VLVIDDEGETLGLMDPRDATEAAKEKGLDLVEVAPNGKPPVCKIMDYGRFKYQQEKKAQESKKHQTIVQLKEIKMRPKTGEHDYQFKVKKIREFLEKGNKVKATIMFRGREIVHSELGRNILLRIAKDIGDLGEVERDPKMEGRNMFIIFASNAKI
jgi:translation initiation factor IF-3